MKIIAFGNRRYKRIAHNWALYLHQHNIKNYTIYSLDQDIYDYLVENKINTELLSINYSSGKKWWKERVEYIYSLLNMGIDILHSDLDAVWQVNPLDFIEKDYDIVASTGTFPFDVYEKIGYTLCMGWIYYKSSDIVKELFQNILNKHKKKSFDDQIEFNRELFNSSKYQELKLKALDQSIISRDKSHTKDTYVAHPLSDRHIDREIFLKNKKLWILND